MQRGSNPLELRADPAGLAPERLLAFELTGDVQNFVRAAQQVPGLEFIVADDLEGDDVDRDPSIYLMVPDVKAFEQIISLWRLFRTGQRFPTGLTPWRDLFAQLRDVRPWGPKDRVTDEDLQVLKRDLEHSEGPVRVELELVYRTQPALSAQPVEEAVRRGEGTVVSTCRIDGAKYHAILADISAAALAKVIERAGDGLAGLEGILHIRPQSLVHVTSFEESEPAEAPAPPAGALDPIAAVLDAVPLSQHTLLAGRLSIIDPMNLEALAVGRRAHGTAMASAIVHGDLDGPPLPPLRRRVFFANVMFATGGPNDEERFPDRLPADVFHEAILRMKGGGQPEAPTVCVVNASLGDQNKPFQGRVSGWARVVDFLSHTYGVLFVISAGNHSNAVRTDDIDVIAFEASGDAERARIALRATAAQMHSRRILSPAESINALTVGAHHSDAAPVAAHLPALTFDVWADTGMSSISSGLGPGFANAVKPDILAPGGRHHVNLMADGHGHLLRPLGSNAGSVAGVRVAAPPSAAAIGPSSTARTLGTSVAAALVTGIAARAHEELEDAYPGFLELPAGQRAVLLKALLVHCAQWTPAHALIVSTLGPSNPRQHVRQKDNVRRFLGYGLADAQVVLDCANDRATLWASATLGSEGSHRYRIPLPEVMSGKPRQHEIAATVAWFAPPRVGTLAYRGVRLKMIEPSESIAEFAVKGSGTQPDINQMHRGTVIHRRWTGDKAAALAPDTYFELDIQREVDAHPDEVAYGLVVSVAMPGVAGVYVEARAMVAEKPRVAVPLGAS